MNASRSGFAAVAMGGICVAALTSLLLSLAIGGEMPASEGEPRRIEELIAGYLAPVEAVEPSAEQKLRAEEFAGQLGNPDKREAALAELVKIGPPALGVLRERLDRDHEIAAPAERAVAGIEAPVKQPLVKALKELKRPAMQAVARKIEETTRDMAAAQKALAEADKAHDVPKATKAHADQEAARKRQALLRNLAALIGGEPSKS